MRNLEVLRTRRRHWSRQRTAAAVAVGVLAVLAGAGTGPMRSAADTRLVAGATASEQPSDRSGVVATRRWPPTPDSVGVPDGTVLSRYRGPCTITKAGAVIKAKTISCSPMHIRTTGVVIRDSKVNGSILVGTQDDYEPTVISDPEGDDPIRVTVLSSEIDASAGADLGFRPISSSHYVVKNSYLHGTYSGGECHNACTIKWSYVHGFGSHASGLRILRNGTLKHNTIWCEPNPRSDDDGDGVPDVDGGCSGNLTMYEEFGTPRDNLVKHNYFPAGWFWYAIKLNGSDGGGIRIVDNRFGLPRSGRRVADDWDAKATNVWSGNTLTNGRVARP